jgi:hypothetical protein
VASLDNLAAPSFSKMRTGIAMMIDPKAKLIDILRRNTLISRRTDRGERELYERIVPLYLPRRLRVR